MRPCLTLPSHCRNTPAINSLLNAGVIAEDVERRLASIVGDQHVRRDIATRRARSTDYSWMSPILRRELDGMLADLVVEPASAAEVGQVLEAAFEGAIPVTPRGKGTGNYGQAVPLAGGIVLDMSRIDSVLDVSGGWLTAEAGTTFVRLESCARRTGQELAMFPSTVRSSLGGFLCGGAGGTGSIEHGLVWDGFLSAAQVVPCAPGSSPAWIEGTGAAAAFLHAFGTTGVLTAATVKLVPARRWTALFASFGAWDDALEAAWALINRDPLPRNVAVDDPDLVAALPHDPAMPQGRVSLRAVIDCEDAGAAGKVVEEAAGRVEAVRAESVSQLVSLSFNHVTLRAVRANPALCHLQVSGPSLATRYHDMRSALAGAMVHVDCYRVGGTPSFGGLLLSEFRDASTLEAGIARLEQLGVTVVNPHTCRLGAHSDRHRLAELARHWDPKGLLNPGKLAPLAGAA